MNLVTDRCLPVVATDGTRRSSSIAELCQAPPGLAPAAAFATGRPELDVALQELTIGSLATGRMPVEDDEVSVLAETRDAAVVRLDLLEIARAFEVDGAKPRFQQDLNEIEGEVQPITNLLLEGAAGFMSKPDRFGPRPVMSRASAGIALHALQSFAPSGGRGHRTSLRGGGPLTTLVVPEPGEDPRPLWDLLTANVPLTSEGHVLPRGARCDPRIFPWLRQTIRSDEPKAPTVSQEDPRVHPLQALWGMPRRVVLVLEQNVERRRCVLTGEVDEVVATGFRMRHGGTNYGTWTHPLTPYRSFKGEFLPMHPSEGRTNFPDWVALSVGSTRRGIRPALCVDAARRRGEATGRIAATGLVTENAKIVHWKGDVVPLVAADADGRKVSAAATRLGEAAEVVARQTRFAVGRAITRRFKDAAAKTQAVAMVEDEVMSRLEPAFGRRLAQVGGGGDLGQALGTDSSAKGDAGNKSGWLYDLRSAAMEVFDRHAPSSDMTGLKAEEVERRILARDGLGFCLAGYGTSGKALFDALGLPPPKRGGGEATKTATKGGKA